MAETSFGTSIRYACRGIGVAWQEANLRRQCIVMLLALILSLVLRISRVEFLLVLVSGALVLGFELINSALEELEDVVHPHHHPAIARSKDVAAGAVLVVSLGALIVGVTIFVPAVVRLVFPA